MNLEMQITFKYEFWWPRYATRINVFVYDGRPSYLNPDSVCVYTRWGP